jgi:hypothetical protein
MKEFEKLVSSPFFNRGRNYLPFLNQLKKFHPRFDDEKLTPEFLYSKIYRGKKFNKQIVWNAASALLNMAEEFMVLKALNKNKFSAYNLLAEEYYERKLARYFVKTLDEMEAKLDRVGISDDYFQSKIQLITLRKVYLFLEDTQHLVPQYVAQQGEYTILSFLRKLSAVLSDMNSNMRMFNAEFDINLPMKFIENLNLKNFVDYAKSKNFFYAWLIEMCYCSIMMLVEHQEIKYYLTLKELVKQHFDKFQAEEKSNWLIMLTGYCVLKFPDGEDYFRKEIFEINKFQLDENVMTGHRFLSKILFIQIIRNALEINETSWVKNFINEYSAKLKPSYQKSMNALGSAYLNFRLKKFDAVIENLKNVKFIDTRDKLYVRNLYIRTYFELNEIEAVLLQIDSAKKFLNSSSSFTAETKTNYLSSLNLLNRFITAIYNKDFDEIESIRKSVENDKGIVFGRWLMEKINHSLLNRR